MSDRTSPPRIEVNDAIYRSPQFRLVPLHVAIKIRPKRYRRFPEEYLDLLHPGSYVKVLAAHAGNLKIREEIWLIIRQLSPVPRLGKHIGEVVPPAKNVGDPTIVNPAGPLEPAPMATWHGLEPGMMIYFQKADVIDVMLNRMETS